MPTDQEKATAKAKKTRKLNLLAKAKETENLKRAKARAKSAEDKLKSFKEGVEYAKEVFDK